MKNKIFTTAVAILLLSAGYAQNLSFGFTKGVGHSWVTGIEDTRFKPNIVIGHTMVYSFNEHWGVGHDLLLSLNEGVRVKQNESNETRWNLNYARMPIKAFYFFGNMGDRVRPKIYAGPSIGVLLWGKSKDITPADGDVKTVVERNIRDDIRTFDFGFVAGAGLNIRIVPKIWLNADITYNNGLADITKGSTWNMNRGIAASMGVTFPIGTYLPEKK